MISELQPATRDAFTRLWREPEPCWQPVCSSKTALLPSILGSSGKSITPEPSVGMLELTGTKSVLYRRERSKTFGHNCSKMLELNEPEIVESVPRSSSGESPGPAMWWSAVFFGSLLFAFVFHLHEEWRLNPHYFYGWGVPILGIILAQKRWQNRPQAEFTRIPGPLFAAGAALLVLWLPLAFLRKANMDWRFLHWAIGGIVIFLLLGAAQWMGGRAWMRHFAFPVLFLLLAVPWPTRVENFLIQGSSELVVRGSVEVLRWMGIAAWSAGNIINLPHSAVGVDEACSGLRSLQGALMCALFLGELKMLSGPKRLILVALGVIAAIGLNLVRTAGLASVAAGQGTSTGTAIDRWHDGAGFGTLAAAFVILWLAARWMRPVSAQKPAALPTQPRFIPRAVVIGCAAWLAVAEATSALWFRMHESSNQERLWDFDRSKFAGFSQENFPPRVRSILRYDEGVAYRMVSADGMEWWVHSLSWKPDGGGAPLARYHSPDVCMPAAGYRLVERGPLLRPVGSEPAFRTYEFERFGKTVFLFSSYHSNTRAGAIRSVDEFDLKWRNRIQFALKGERPAEQKVLQVLISGAPDGRAAREAFEAFAKRTLQREL